MSNMHQDERLDPNVQLLRVFEIAKIKGVSKQYIYSWIQKGIIPKNKIKRKTIKKKIIFVNPSVLENEIKNYPIRSKCKKKD